MSRLLTIEKPLLFKVLYYLNLHDLLQLAETCPQLNGLIYGNPRIWNQHVLFPHNDQRITDTFIEQIVPKITRHYGIRTLQVIQLPLSWLGYLYTFDQFAHTVERIQIKTTLGHLQDLVHHLTIFAANLTVLQQINDIPITFRQYCQNPTLYYQVLVDRQFFGEKSVAQLAKTLVNKDKVLGFSQLDDPPFERLNQWQFGCTSNANGDNDLNANMAQLEAIVSFLAGRKVQVTCMDTPTPTPTTPNPFYIMTGQKRSQDQLEPTNRQKQRLVSPSLQTSSLYV